MNRRKKKQQITINNLDSIQGLMQEVYNDSCAQINDIQRAINELANSTVAETVDDITKIAKEKTNAYKVKDSAIKVKLEVAKLLNDIVKHNGNIEETDKARSNNGSPTLEEFSRLRNIIKKDNEG